MYVQYVLHIIIFLPYTLNSSEFSPLTFVSLLFQTSLNAALIMAGVTRPAPTVPAPSAAVVTQGSPWTAMGKPAKVR